jgi:hypothetical protein
VIAKYDFVSELRRCRSTDRTGIVKDLDLHRSARRTPVVLQRLSFRAGGAFAVIAICCLTASDPAAAPQQAPTQPASAMGTAVLWRDPGSMAGRDLFWGSASETRAPQGPFTFVEEDTSGTQPKVTVTDTRGQTWDVKFGHEVPAEIASNRFLWALGFLGEEMYLVRDGIIQGGKELRRAAEHLGPNASFKNARFRRRDPQIMRTDEEWTFQKNPFVGTKELSGLMIVMNLINNWDVQGSRNNKVLEVTMAGRGSERWFIVSDLGATFGRMGGPLGRKSKWNLKDYLAEDFIEAVKDGYLKLDYEGFGKDDLGLVPLEHARWFAALASQLTMRQLRRAFEAAGATPEEVDGYSKKLSAKITELQNAVSNAGL